jgi:hypothetical protein
MDSYTSNGETVNKDPNQNNSRYETGVAKAIAKDDGCKGVESYGESLYFTSTFCIL